MKYIVDACKHELADDKDELITTKMSMHYSRYICYFYSMLLMLVSSPDPSRGGGSSRALRKGLGTRLINVLLFVIVLFLKIVLLV